MGETCKNCRFWRRIDESLLGSEDERGNCRRFPPKYDLNEAHNHRLDLGDGEQMASLHPLAFCFPQTWATEWCGEWQEQPAGEWWQDPGFAEPIESLELPVRALNCLKFEGIVFIGDLVQYTERRLLRVKNLGKTSLGSIRETLRARGFQLGTEVRNWEQVRRTLLPVDSAQEMIPLSGDGDSA